MNSSVGYITTRLSYDARSQDRTRFARCTLWVCSGLIAFMAVLSCLDYWSGLSVWRFGFIPMALLALGFYLVGLVRIVSKPTNWKETALNLEANQTEQDCLVSTSVEYLEKEPGKSHQRLALEDALHEAAAKKLVAMEISLSKPLRAPLATTGISCLSLLAFVVAVPESQTALTRLVLPWKPIPYSTLEVEPGNVSVPIYSSQEIKVAWEGRAPEQAAIYYRDASAEHWESAPLNAITEGTLSFEFERVLGDLDYQILAHGVQSPRYSIHAYRPPTLVNVEIKCSPPAYTQRSADVLYTPDVSVLRGSRLDMRFQCTKEVASATIRFDDQREQPLEPMEGVWQTTMILEEDKLYWLELTDHEGRKGGNQLPFQLVALPDEKPMVRIIDPGADIRAEARSVIPIQFEAGDDFGLEQVELRYKKMNGEEKSASYPLPQGRLREFSGQLEIDLGPLELGAYEVIYYYLRAVDNNSIDGPGEAESPVYFVEVTSKGDPLSDCLNPVQRFNLLHLEKQVIAQAQAISQDDSRGFDRLGRLQHRTLELSRMYENSYELALAPELARAEFAAAQDAMAEAVRQFGARARGRGLLAAERALAHLYETVRLLPELEAGMCRGKGNRYRVVLEAIEETRKKEENELTHRLRHLLNQARSALLAEEEWLRRLIDLVQSEDRSTDPSGMKEGKMDQRANRSVVKGEHSSQGASRGGMRGVSELDELRELSEEQAGIAKRIAELARDLDELSNRDERVPPVFSEETRIVSQHFIRSQEEIQNSTGRGIGYSRKGIMVLASVIEGLDALESSGVGPSSIDLQLYPEKYEALIAEYLKGLSFAE